VLLSPFDEEVSMAESRFPLWHRPTLPIVNLITRIAAVTRYSSMMRGWFEDASNWSSLFCDLKWKMHAGINLHRED
jgi:hypothetical protein